MMQIASLIDIRKIVYWNCNPEWILLLFMTKTVVAKISKVGGFSRRCNGQEPLLHLIAKTQHTANTG
jgi:hypothetical protein